MSADASYVIDIAANMSGAAQTTAQIDSMTEALTKAGVTSEHIHDAIAGLTNQLADAAKASSAAATALGEGQAEYARLEKAALQAAKAEEKASKAGFVPTEVHAAALATAGAVSKYADELKKLEAESDKTGAAEKALAATLAKAKGLHVETAEAAGISDGQLRKLKGALPALGGAFGQVGGQIAGVVDDFGDISEAFGTGAAAAVAAVGAVTLLVAAVGALAVATVYGVAKVSVWAVGLADANREIALTTEATEILNPSLEKLHGTIDGLTSSTGLTELQIDGIAESLKSAHVAASDMPAALQAASLAEAALGQGGAQTFIARMQTSGQSVRKFSATVSTELGGVVQKKLLGLTAQTAQFKQNVSTLFGGLNIDPALSGLQKLVGLFDETTSSGQAIKFLFEKIFQPLIDQADNAATVIEGFALGFEIGMVRLYIALKPTIKAIGEFFGQHDPSLTDTLAAVTAAGEKIAPVVAAMVVGFTAATVIVGAVVGVSLALAAAFLLLPVAIAAAAVWLEVKFLGAVAAVYSYLSSIDLTQIGSDLIAGLARGITAGAGAIISAISGVVTGGIDAARHLLGIHSPSTVFAAIGDNTVAGFAGGVDDAAPQAQSALESLVDPSSAQAASLAPARRAAQSSASSGNSTNFQGATFQFYGVKDAEDAESRFSELLTRVIEGDLGSLGGAVA